VTLWRKTQQTVQPINAPSKHAARYHVDVKYFSQAYKCCMQITQRAASYQASVASQSRIDITTSSVDCDEDKPISFCTTVRPANCATSSLSEQRESCRRRRCVVSYSAHHSARPLAPPRQSSQYAMHSIHRYSQS